MCVNVFKGLQVVGKGVSLAGLVCGVMLSSSLLNAAPADNKAKAKQATGNMSADQRKRAEDGMRAVQRLESFNEATLEKGKRRYKSCAICHGSKGDVTAPGQLEGRTILDRDYAALVKELQDYRAGTADNGGLNVIMTVNMDEWTDQEIQDVSAHINALRAEYNQKAKAKAKSKAPKKKKSRDDDDDE